MPTKALIPIPQNMTVVGSQCIQVSLPDDAEWKAMFWGALYQLTAWNSYDRDDAQSGAYCAGIWKSILADARASECAMPISFRRTSTCLTEYSEDGGTTWNTLYNGDDCLTQQLLEGRVAPGNPTEWSHAYDFTASQAGWALRPSFGYGAPDQGVWNAGFGFQDAYYWDVPTNTGYRGVFIEKTWVSSAHITIITVEWPVFTVGSHVDVTDGSQGDSMRIYSAGPTNVYNSCPPLPSPRTFTINITTTYLGIYLWPGFNGAGISDPGGAATIARVTVAGTGTDPGP